MTSVSLKMFFTGLFLGTDAAGKPTFVFVELDLDDRIAPVGLLVARMLVFLTVLITGLGVLWVAIPPKSSGHPNHHPIPH